VTAPAGQSAPIRIVLVDDVDDVRRLLRIALRSHGGFEVVGEAASGSDAVTLARTLSPDVVVLDLGLPDIAGRDLLSRVRAAAPESKIVVSSGAVGLDYLAELLESVASPFQSQASIDLPHALSSVAQAREFVRDTLAEWGIDEPVDDALLVVSELAANALTHARSSYRVRLSATPHALRIEVDDDGTGTPEPRALTETEEHGRGLFLVDSLSASWGMEAGNGTGKRIWAELALPTAVGAE
jgi:CheY-like chemotaxis protein